MNMLATYTFLAANLLSEDVTRFLIRFVVILVICAIVAFLVAKAPFIEASWKPIIQWFLIAIPVIYLLVFLVSFL